jgi:hypothetical protein
MLRAVSSSQSLDFKVVQTKTSVAGAWDGHIHKSTHWQELQPL